MRAVPLPRRSTSRAAPCATATARCGPRGWCKAAASAGDTGYFPGLAQIGERLGGFDLALMENGAYDSYWPAVHMTPEQTLQAFRDLRAKSLYSVHNSTFDLAFHPWQEPLERLATLA